MNHDPHCEIDNQISGLSDDIGITDALALAHQLHRAGHLDDAEALYRRILDAAPDSASAWHFLGLLQFQRGQGGEAIAALERAISFDPSYADAHANLANILIAAHRIEEAEPHLRRALELAPDAAPPRIALAVIYNARREFDAAEALLREALITRPDDVAVENGLANVLLGQGRVEEALAHFWKAIALDPSLGESRQLIGVALGYLGRFEEAAQQYREWLEREPEHPVARHMLAACGGAEMPHRADDAYVRNTFDSFAATFDAKLAHLDYRAPELVAAAVESALNGRRVERLLDAGCGTGLLGPRLRSLADCLVGVDLSPGMLANARFREVYDELVEAELTAHLGAYPDQYEVVASADTLCYFGMLETLAEAAHRALLPCGWLVFTVELLEGEGDYKLNHHGRYSHTADYVRRVLVQTGFVAVDCQSDWLRTECGKRVDGLIVSAQRGH